MDNDQVIQILDHALFREQPDPFKHYYFFTRILDSTNEIEISCDSCWVDFAPGTKHDLRIACENDPVMRQGMLTSLGWSSLIINTFPAYDVWLAVGGFALIVEDVAKNNLPAFFNPHRSVRRAGRLGFEAISDNSELLARRLGRHARLAIKKDRDGSRCKICENECDLAKLELHHIHPFAEGGLTEWDNLITVCRPCHEKIGDGIDWSLYGKIAVDPIAGDVMRDIFEGIIRYRKVFSPLLGSIIKGERFTG